MRFVWTPCLATGIRQVDLQHQELLEIGNALERAAQAQAVARAVDEILPRLSAYVTFHFSTEERLIAGRPGAASHRARHLGEHRAFARRVAALRSGAPTPAELIDFVDYLARWLVGHIQTTDRELITLVGDELVACGEMPRTLAHGA